MGWREVLGNALDVSCGPIYVNKGAPVANMLLAMPPADRIALARELLAGTGLDITALPDEWEIPGEFAEGWNACRAAMLAEDGADG